MAKIKNISSSRNRLAQFFIRFGIGIFLALIIFSWILEYLDQNNLDSNYRLTERQKDRLENTRPDTIDYTPSLNEDMLHNLGYVIGFNKGVHYTLEKIENEYPSLRARVLKANNRFEREFGKSVDFIDSLVFSGLSDQLEARNQFDKRLESEIDKQRNYINYDFSLEYLEIIENLPESFPDTLAINTLLVFHPDYIASPELEFIDGYKERFQSQSHPKAKGLEFQIDLPKSWIAKEANRPNIVQKFISRNGEGFDMCMVLVSELGNEFSGIEKEELKSFSEQDFFEFLSALGENSYLIGGDYIELDDLKGFKVEYYVKKKTELVNLWTRFKMYNLFYRDKLIQLQFSTAVKDDKLYKLNPKFNRSDKLFSLIANSLVIKTKWEE